METFEGLFYVKMGVSEVVPSPSVPMYPPSLHSSPPQSCFLILEHSLKIFLAVMLLINLNHS
jgi:hypothetical protein